MRSGLVMGNNGAPVDSLGIAADSGLGVDDEDFVGVGSPLIGAQLGGIGIFGAAVKSSPMLVCTAPMFFVWS